MRLLRPSSSNEILLVKLLSERERDTSLLRIKMEGGNEPKKLFWLNKLTFRFLKGERSGIGPESELLLRLIILSLMSFDKVWGGNLLWRLEL
jgi:hypothetical protein